MMLTGHALLCLSTFLLALLNSHMYKTNKNVSPIEQLGSTEYCLKLEKDVDAFNLLFTQNVLMTIQHQTEREKSTVNDNKMTSAFVLTL